MAEWQDAELAGFDDIAYVVAMHADTDNGPADPEDLELWQTYHGFEADALLMDNGRNVIDGYIDANPGPTYTEAVTVIIDKEMRIRHVGGTYDKDDQSNLELLIELANE